MTEYRKVEGNIEHRPTKYDGFKLIKTEKPYRHQKGSGRSACFDLAKDGMLIGAWTKKCSDIGYDSKFVVGSLIKLSDAEYAGWKISEKNDKGLTIDQIKKVRDVDPVKAAEREEKVKAVTEAKAVKKAERDAKKAATEAKKAEPKKEKKKKAAVPA